MKSLSNRLLAVSRQLSEIFGVVDFGSKRGLLPPAASTKHSTSYFPVISTAGGGRARMERGPGI